MDVSGLDRLLLGADRFRAVWFYRRDNFRSGRNFFMKGLFPFLGGLMLLGAFVIASVQYAQSTYGSTAIGGVGGVFIIGIGTLLLGVALMFVWNIIAPDLSNLPPGAQALDLESGKEIADDAGLRSLREDQRTMNETRLDEQ
jgi:hypothetical protein